MINRQTQNLHTHTIYGDGADTPEEMILEALKKGHFSIGFSEHVYTPFSPMFSNRKNQMQEYKKEINDLKKKYESQIKIYCGIEDEMYVETDFSGYDYLIGSFHYLKLGNEYIGFDRTEDVVKEVIDNYFNGKGIEYAKEYYKQLSLLPEHGNYDIVGHFDIITKHSENREFFDVNSKEYLTVALDAIHALEGKIPFFEVNTGAMARGYRKTPYPFETIIKEFKKAGFGAVVTADCHDKRFLDYKFDEAMELLKYCGFEERYVLTENGFSAISL